MKRQRRRLISMFLVLILLCFAFCQGCGVRESRPLLLGEDNGLTRVLGEAFPEYRLQSPAGSRYGNLYSAVQAGHLAACLDVEALPAVEAGTAGAFQPLIAVTVVFTVDPARTDLRPDSWQALRESGLPVSFPENGVMRRLALASLAYGLEGPDYGKQAALHWMASLEEENRFFYGREDCPVTVCLDAQAAGRIAQGEELLVVVPRDGTLTFLCGLLSGTPPELNVGEDLLEAGFRLPDGSCRNPAYPKDYSSAAPVDCDRFTEASKDATRDIRRSVQHIRYFGSADGRESILLFSFSMILSVVWIGSALHRSPDRETRRWVWLIGIQIVLWLMISLIKYILYRSSLLTRLLWYAYYLFLMGLPLTMLYISAVIDRPISGRRVPRWLLPFLAVYPLLIAAVFTNDFHQLVFRFDLAGNWDADYQYGPGYFIIFAYCLISFLLSLGLLIYKSRKSPKRCACIGPILVALLLIVYNVGYILSLPLFRDTNLALIFCLFSIAFLESAMNAGLLATNTRYRDMFSSSPLDIQLLDQSGNTVLASSRAEPLTMLERVQIMADPGASFYRGENSLLHSRKIHGGVAIWQEDLTRLNELRRKLCTSIEQMESANALLHREGEIRRQKIAAEFKIQLFTQLEQELSEQTRELAQVIRTLPDSPERSGRIARIPLLLCHIKRRSNLFFLAQQDSRMSGNELAMYLDELSEFSSYAGIHALVRCGIDGAVEVEAVTLCYDFYFTALSWSIEKSHAVLIGQLEEKDGLLSFSILCSESTASLEFPRSFSQRVEAFGGEITCRRVDESDSIHLTFLRKGSDAP